MSTELVDRLLLAVKSSRVTDLEYEAAGVRVRIERGVRGVQAAVEPDRPRPVTDGDVIHAGAESMQLVRASLHGTFFRAPAPEQPPLVEVGQHVRAGQQVALIEAMKMLHAIECDHTGKVVEVLAANGSAVEPGTPLLVIDASEAVDV
jgi:biotin carboxyl carrier protein